MGLQNAAQRAQTDVHSSAPITTAVILAAGNGSRLQSGEKIIPKPLIKVGGLHLIERTILNLRAAGIDRFRIVVGAYKEQIIATLQGLRSLRRLNIEFIDCPNYEAGNGISLATGCGAVEESFVVTMADHVMTTDTVANFVTSASQMPHLALLGTDPRTTDVFDLDDATKVQTDGQRITAIGKELTTFDQIDLGLFYFPAGYGALLAHHAAHGATSVSALVQRINHTEGFFTVPLPNAMWQDVDTPSMAREAETRLLHSLRKPTDGYISRRLNRRLSLSVSRILARWRVSPNFVTTFVFLLTVAAAYFVASPEYRWIALGGLLFQVASILDGCDGELSRLTFRGSTFGAWYDTITDNVRYIFFFICMGISAYRSSENPLYLWTIGIFLGVAAASCIKMTVFTARAKRGTHLAVTARVHEFSKTSTHWWERFAIVQAPWIKQDVSAFVAMVFALVGQPGLMLVVCCYAVIVMAISIWRAIANVAPQPTVLLTKKRKEILKATFLFVIGFSILGFMLSQMPMHEVWTSLRGVGKNMWMVFAVAPLWFMFNTFSLSVLIGNRVHFADLFYNQLVGEAINTIVPLAGLAGEPYKVKHLSQWLPLANASRAIVQNKFIHAITGLLFGGMCGGLTALMVPLGSNTLVPLIFISVGFLIAAGIFTMVALSRAPDHITAFVLTKLKFLGSYQEQRVDPKLFAVSLIHKMIGRTINLLEVVAILYLLGLPFSLGDVLAIEACVSATAVLFVIVPQGLGVNEAGIAVAFALLGIPAPLAISFGIIRRMRVMFWACAGLVVHFIVTVMHQYSAALTEPTSK